MSDASPEEFHGMLAVFRTYVKHPGVRIELEDHQDAVIVTHQDEHGKRVLLRYSSELIEAEGLLSLQQLCHRIADDIDKHFAIETTRP